MREGYVSAGGYRILWTPKERRFSLWPQAEDVVLKRMSFTGEGTPACLCETCRKVILSY
ncbi:hypothetical protein BACCAP_01335 [Pseudoflavonifractor capillosus ATCC 29799]|uniref:DUF6487 domain-containing protein n=2 Tax=Pseudoflavonifractor capillosus TaxID=106588 RepID=A6NT06_9FIRM|nr:hypothetical protein BACCAP_01335 [Pseudoflavonifractor capillosus ATCC 29799]